MIDPEYPNNDAPQVEPQSPIRNCVICSLPLEPWQQPLEYWTFHKEGPCTECKYCGKQVGRDRILNCIRNEEVISHTPCHDKAVALEFESRPVIITQGHLNYLNRLIQFACKPNPLISLDENIEQAAETSREFIKDMNMEDKFRHLKMLEAAAATVSIAINNDKERIFLKIQRDDITRENRIKDLKGIKTAEQIRELQKQQQDAKAKRERIKSDPREKAKEKVIEGLMKFNMSREDAESQYETMMENAKARNKGTE